MAPYLSRARALVASDLPALGSMPIPTSSRRALACSADVVPSPIESVTNFLLYQQVYSYIYHAGFDLKDAICEKENMPLYFTYETSKLKDIFQGISNIHLPQLLKLCYGDSLEESSLHFRLKTASVRSERHHWLKLCIPFSAATEVPISGNIMRGFTYGKFDKKAKMECTHSGSL